MVSIIEGESRLDTSPITGEPVPVGVSAGDEITSGCVNTSGQLKMRVEKPLSESMVSRILESMENAAASKPKIDRFITRFAKIYTPCVVIAAVHHCYSSICCERKLELLDLHSHFLFGNELPMCPCIKRAAGILLRYRCRFQKRYPVQRRTVHGIFKQTWCCCHG